MRSTSARYPLVTKGSSSGSRPREHGSGTLLLRQQGTHFRDQVRWDRHHRDVLGFLGGLDLGELLVLGLALVMGQDFADAGLIPARGELRFAHEGFLRRR